MDKGCKKLIIRWFGGAIPATRRPTRTNSDETWKPAASGPRAARPVPARGNEGGATRAGLGPMRPAGSRGRQDAGCVSEGCYRRGPWPSLQEADVEAGGGRRAGLKVTVFAQFTETQILPDSPPGWGRAIPRQSPTVWSRIGAVETGPGMRRGGIRGVAHPWGKVSAEQVAGSGIPIGERSLTPRRHRPRPATALGGPCRLQGMRPPHECSGNRHYPCGSRFANEEGRRSDEPQRHQQDRGENRGCKRRRRILPAGAPDRRASRGSPVTSLTENLLTLVTAFLYHSPLTEGEFGKRAIGEAGSLRGCERGTRLPWTPPTGRFSSWASRPSVWHSGPRSRRSFSSPRPTEPGWGVRLSEIIPS